MLPAYSPTYWTSSCTARASWKEKEADTGRPSDWDFWHVAFLCNSTFALHQRVYKGLNFCVCSQEPNEVKCTEKGQQCAITTNKLLKSLFLPFRIHAASVNWNVGSLFRILQICVSKAKCCLSACHKLNFSFGFRKERTTVQKTHSARGICFSQVQHFSMNDGTAVWKRLCPLKNWLTNAVTSSRLIYMFIYAASVHIISLTWWGPTL